MSTGPQRILVAGGGPAAIEGLLALRAVLVDARLELIAPLEEFVYRPLAIAEAFALDRPSRFRLSEIASAASASFRRDMVISVDRKARTAVTSADALIEFDAMLVAIGARSVEALPGATTFWGEGGDPEFARELRALERGERREITFAIPHRVSWGLPLYELAMMTAEHLHERGVAVHIAMITPEPEPLAVFGGEVSAALTTMLAARGIDLHLSTDPLDFMAAAQDASVITLPRLVGRGMPDLPVDDHGFLATDDYGRILGSSGFYAAGDVTDSPIKQGGLGTQQAEAAAHTIAADLGEGPRPQPADSVLRGRMFREDAQEPAYMRRDLGAGEPSEFDHVPLWWPGAKIFGRHLAPLLAQLEAR